MGESIGDSIDEVLQSVDRMRADVVGVDKEKITKEHEVSGWERLLAGTGGLIIGGVGGAMMGGMFGYKEMIKNIIPYFGIMVGGAILGITNPWIFIGLLFAGGTIQGLLKSMSVTSKIKEKVVEEYIKGLKDKARAASKDAATQVHQKTKEIVELVKTGLQDEIQSVLDMAANAIQEHQLGDSQKKQKLLALEKSEEDLIQMRSQLDDIIIDVAL